MGGKFGRWELYHFVIRSREQNGEEVKRLLIFGNVHTEQDKFFQARIKDCTVDLPKSERARHEWAIRIDTKKGRKLIVDPGTQKDRDAWITHLYECGAKTPPEYWTKDMDVDEDHE